MSYMPVTVTYFDWAPPKLTEVEEIELGREVARIGSDTFVRQFMERSALAEKEKRKKNLEAARANNSPPKRY